MVNGFNNKRRQQEVSIPPARLTSTACHSDRQQKQGRAHDPALLASFQKQRQLSDEHLLSSSRSSMIFDDDQQLQYQVGSDEDQVDTPFSQHVSRSYPSSSATNPAPKGKGGRPKKNSN